MSWDWISDPDVWVGLVTLTMLEVVLGIDNLIFISILSGKLPAEQQARARRIGLALALISRILLLCSLAWVMKLDQPLWQAKLFGLQIPHSGKDLILFFGGLFLVGKSVYEIHEKIEEHPGENVTPRGGGSFTSVIIQILLLDIVFSLDSVITAVGMAQKLGVMIAAVMVSVFVMLFFVNQIGAFVDRHPTIKMLALSFLILIGTLLVAESFHQHLPKGYIYFAMFFAMALELLNLRVRARHARPKISEPV